MIKRVLAYAFGEQSHRDTLHAAASLAADNDALLTGLFVTPDFAGYTTIYGNHSLDLSQSFRDSQKEFATKAQHDFEDMVAKFQLKSEWHTVNQFESTPKPSNYADIIFVSQPNSKSSVLFNGADFVDYLITDTGLPTIIIPAGWSGEHIARHPVLGWKECREAVGAVRHSLPLMRQSLDVDIVTVRANTDLDEELIEGSEIGAYLTSHGVNTEYFAVHMSTNENRPVETLLRHVRERSRDLIIIGGYSHSRLREIILGGMTRALIQESPVPVLLSH